MTTAQIPRASRVALLVLLAMMVSQGPAHGDASAKAPADIKGLVRSLGSPDCRVRKGAVLEARRSLVPEEEPTRYLDGLRQALDGSQGDVRRRLALIAKDAEAEAAFWAKRWKELSFVEQVRGSQSREEQAKRIEKARKTYLAVIRNPNESANARGMAAGEMLFAIDRFHQFSQEKASPFPPGALGTWTSDLVELLRSSDSTVRLIGALAAGARPGIPGRTVRKGAIIPELIAGLRHPELTFRIGSQTTLEALTARESCLDPTDLDAQREPEIKAWEAWWSLEKKKIAQEKFPGS